MNGGLGSSGPLSSSKLFVGTATGKGFSPRSEIDETIDGRRRRMDAMNGMKSTLTKDEDTPLGTDMEDTKSCR